MLDSILAALHQRRDLQAWSVRHVVQHDAQLYSVAQRVQARREVENEYFVIDVLCDTSTAEAQTCGTATITLLSGDDANRAINEAALMAGLVHNPPHSIPARAEMPSVPLADAELLTAADRSTALNRLYARLQQAVRQYPPVRLTASEFFADETTTHLVNSCGLDATQTATSVAAEWVLINRSDGQETEAFSEMTRRRADDIDIEGEVALRAQGAIDLLQAAPALNYAGPVVLRGDVLANFICGDNVLADNGLFAVLGSARSKFSQLSKWEIGQSIFRGEVRGDPLTVWATRQLPYGTHSNRFDDEGLPAQRVLLVENNRLATFTASQRYAEYLSLPPTGAFGNIEVLSGRTAQADLLAEPYVEIVAFSWFNPDSITGDFATEIRLGYVVDAKGRRPFKGGLLIGNVLDALANVRWSRETAFSGNYLGPAAARFGQLTVAGS
ncbi:MAG TPA: metallopeptidase TldD-related protein [Anaerolineae bacterium]|nr:metallopeptidase TldD-related protein [Anaerolineae bacterium]